MTLREAPTLTTDMLAGKTGDELLDMARVLRREGDDMDQDIGRLRGSYRAANAVLIHAFIALHSPFQVGERLRLIADASEWTVTALSTAPATTYGVLNVPRYAEIVMQRFNRDGRLGEVTRTFTFMAGNAIDVARFERVGT